MSHDSEAAVDALGDLRDARLLGNSGLRVSPLCFGCMNLGDSSMADQETSRKLMEQYIEQGGNFFDTANVYEKGMSEKWLGEFLQSQRSRAVIATKFGGCTDGSDPNAGGNHRKNLVQSLDASLKRLGTDYVDLLYVHIWEYRTPVEEVMRSLDDVVRSGKALYVAISDTVAWKIAQANTTATLRGWSPFVGVQTQYSLTERTAERDLLPCATTRLQPPPWASLTGPAAAESTYACSAVRRPRPWPCRRLPPSTDARTGGGAPQSFATPPLKATPPGPAPWRRCCRELGLGVVPWGSLSQGLLTGKYNHLSVAQAEDRAWQESAARCHPGAVAGALGRGSSHAPATPPATLPKGTLSPRRARGLQGAWPGVLAVALGAPGFCRAG